MAEEANRTIILDESDVQQSFVCFSPVDVWNKENEDVFSISSGDEYIVETLKESSQQSITSDNDKPSETAMEEPNINIQKKMQLEECEIFVKEHTSDNISDANNVFMIPEDPQCSKNCLLSRKVTEVSPSAFNEASTSKASGEGNFEVVEIDDSINDSVITIHDSDSDSEECSTPPRLTKKRKTSLGSSPIAVCSKHITTGINTQHTETRLDSYFISDIDLISKKLKIDKNLVQKVVGMLIDDCTVPFISRYRQQDIQSLNCDNVREISDMFKDLKKAQKKVEEIQKLLNKRNCWTTELQETFSKCTNELEVEKLFLPYENEDDDAMRAKHLRLDESAKLILEGATLKAEDFVKTGCNGLDTSDKIFNGWRSVITDMIRKDCEVMTYLSTLFKEHVPVLETELIPDRLIEVYYSDKTNIARKYLKFNKWKMPLNSINTQTVFKINRGEKEGILRVYVIFSEEIQKKLHQFCLTKWKNCCTTMLSNCVYLAWDNFLKPNFAQHIRLEMTNEAHKVALKVFRDNVKYLLLDEPIRGKTVLGIDPGHDNGCKLAVVSPWGIPIANSIVYLTTDIGKINARKELKRLVLTFECDVIALGNGNGCREIESLLKSMIKKHDFNPFKVIFKIISESGVSCYSVSAEASEEFPDLSPNIISAISIARRLQDPLSELVKTDPKKLEVGMYLRDIEAKKVDEVFNEVVVECVSFVGVDVNIASRALLSRVSGITSEIANSIIMNRVQNGPFKNRKQLRNIEGVTSKNFEQFSGFVKIIPETTQLQGEEFDLLDSTIIHPESYADAERLLGYMGVQKESIGTPYICEVIEQILSRFEYRDLAVFCATSVSTIIFLIDVFKKPLNHDLRLETGKFVYKSKIINCEDVRPNMHLRGRVMNVTPIGAFIDVGFGGGRNAYLPPSKDEMFCQLVPRQIVVVQVIKMDWRFEKCKVRLKKIVQ